MLTATGINFRMGVAIDPEGFIVFTPDGRVGLVPQDDGSIGVFRFEDSGQLTVVHAHFAGPFSAGKIIMQPAGDKIWVLDPNTEGNGGGIYQVDIGCDGTLSNATLVMAGNTPSAATYSNTELLVAAGSLPATPVMQDLHLVNVSKAPPAVLTSTTGFPDRDALAPTLSCSADNRFIAMPDNGFSVGSRVAFYERLGNTLTAKQVIANSSTVSPVGIAFSPYFTTGLLVNSDGADAYRRVTWDGTAFSVGAPIAYAHGKPQLPSAPVMITRGALTGRMLIAELDAIRQLQFETDGGITDVSKTPAGGTNFDQIVGTIGVAP